MAVGTSRMLKQFYQHGSAMGEPKFVAGDAAGGGGMTPAKQAIQKQIDALWSARTNETIGQQEYFSKLQQLHAQLAAA